MYTAETVHHIHYWPRLETFGMDRDVYCMIIRSCSLQRQFHEIFDPYFFGLKGVCHEIFGLQFFSWFDWNPSGPLINRLKYYRIPFRFRRDIRSQRVICGVVSSQALGCHDLNVVVGMSESRTTCCVPKWHPGRGKICQIGGWQFEKLFRWC